MKKIILFILLIPFFSFGQVTFIEAPSDRQLIPRNLTTNEGNFVIAGEVDSILTPYSLIKLEIFREGILYNTSTQTLTYTNNLANFSFNATIMSELANYSIRIYGSTAIADILIKEVVDIVAGDAYIIQGQSNAEARIRYDSSNANQSNFIRVYASGTDNPSLLELQDQWYIAQGDGANFTSGNSGQWGLKLAKSIVDTYNIPVAIFNGARGNRVISYFLRDTDYQSTLESNYSRLYYRLNKTNLTEYVRAIFWSQGEAQSDLSNLDDYKNYFLQLKSTWLQDYPNLEKFYIFQTRLGDCVNIAKVKLSQEPQRRLAFENDDIHIMTTSALEHYTDYCHFVFAGGYDTFATRIFELVKRDLYNETPIEDIEPPMVIDVYLQDDTTVVIDTDASALLMTAQPQEFELNNAGNAQITNIKINKNQIKILLSENPGLNATISYAGPPGGTIGNFITNSKGIELVNFHEFPINDKPSCPFSTTRTSTGWNNGAPNSFTTAIIDSNYNLSSLGNFDSCNCQIKQGISLIVPDNEQLIIYNDLTIEGSLEIGNEGSLITMNSNANITGNITKYETTTPLNNFRDFTYWSSPVNTTISEAFVNVNSNRIFEFNTNSYSWNIASGSMIPAKGYIAEAPVSTPDQGTHTVNFTGTPHNGTIEIPVVFNDDGLDYNDFNLIGNPYPSAIDIHRFISDEDNSSMNGTIWLWTHNTAISNGTTGEFLGDDYATYNIVGGTAASENEDPPTQNIGSGQGFFVKTLNEGSLTFKNNMRLEGQNTQFYRNIDHKEIPILEKNRLWLNAKSKEGGAFSQALIGFFEKATDEYDRGYDGQKLSAGWISLYSKIDTVAYAIQGLGKFKNEKEVSLGFDTFISRPMNYEIKIGRIEGNDLTNSDIFLIDHVLQITHNLKESAYEFSLESTENNPDRFTLRFTSSNSELNTGDQGSKTDFIVINNKDNLELRSDKNFANIKIYDLLGRNLLKKFSKNTSVTLPTYSFKTGSILLINVQFEDDTLKTKKIILQ